LKKGRLSLTPIELFRTLIEVFLAFLLFSVLLGHFEILQNSMEPNFHEGQRILVWKLKSLLPPQIAKPALAANGPQQDLLTLKRGQVVVFYETADPKLNPLIKRVVGLPGETIDLYQDKVWINGNILGEPYLAGFSTSCSVSCKPLTLGPNDYFLLGDNRPVSRDSRSFGPIPVNQIVGQVILRYWPFDQIAFYP